MTPKRPPHATADPHRWRGSSTIPAFPACTLIGPGGEHGPCLGTCFQPGVSPVRATRHRVQTDSGIGVVVVVVEVLSVKQCSDTEEHLLVSFFPSSDTPVAEAGVRIRAR